MAKIVLDSVEKLTELSTINNNFDKIEAELQNKVFYRNNPVGEPNTLETDIDANNKTLFNVGELRASGLILNGSDITASVASAAADAASAAASAATATTKASEASASASSAATSATNAATSATTASNAATTATTQATQAATSASSAATSETNAATSASNAATSETNAATSASTATTKAAEADASAVIASASSSAAGVSATNAATSETNALASENKAFKWAEEAEDVPVEVGKFSAKHWAAKAEDIVIGALINDATTTTTSTWSSTKVSGELATKLNATNPSITGSITETVFTLTGTTPVLEPDNGTVQEWTLSGASSPTDGFSSGQSLTLVITPGANTITWPTISWTKVGGSGTAPTLFSSGKTVVVLWKAGTTLYGSHLGDV